MFTAIKILLKISWLTTVITKIVIGLASAKVVCNHIIKVVTESDPNSQVIPYLTTFVELVDQIVGILTRVIILLGGESPIVATSIDVDGALKNIKDITKDIKGLKS